MVSTNVTPIANNIIVVEFCFFSVPPCISALLDAATLSFQMITTLPKNIIVKGTNTFVLKSSQYQCKPRGLFEKLHSFLM